MTSNALPYPIVVADSVREELREFLKARAHGRVIFLADANVASYAVSFARDLSGRTPVLPFDLGERAKTFATVEAVHAALVRNGADRETTVVGVGGGVASDVFGLAAALFMRGVPYVHVATSLVAMVDAAIGGKTGVNLAAGKNLAGTFADPIGVFAHVRALRTLPYRHVREGLAEVVKMGIIEGDALFSALETLAPHPFHQWPWETIVSESVAVKAMFVSEDRTERGARAVLNLGHTFGHGLERASGYRISHGAGVSIGLRAAGLLALRCGRFSREAHLRVLTLQTLLQLPARTTLPPARVFEAMLSDKKRRDGTLRFVLPRDIGDVEYGIEAPNARVRAVLQQIAQPPGAREFH